MTEQYNWVDNPTESGVAQCDTDVLNECLMHLKYDKAGGKGGGYIGQLSYGIRTDIPEGQLRCDGATYFASLLQTFFDEFLVGGKIPTCTMTEYEQYLTNNNGNCGFIGLDETGQTFRMPTLKDRVFIAQALNAGNIAEFNFDQIVNITGSSPLWATPDMANVKYSGALYQSNTLPSGYATTTYTTTTTNGTRLDASKVVRTGDQVQPQHIQYPLFMAVSNVSVPASEVQYNAFINSLTNKANIDLSNVSGNIAFIAESWLSSDGNSWYRKWSDGWIEQGATLTWTSVVSTHVVRNLIIPFAGVSYIITGNVLSSVAASGSNSPLFINKINNSTFSTSLATQAQGFCWYACGYGN